jgi:glycosyltransferase involved in cell wall biosynthesis
MVKYYRKKLDKKERKVKVIYVSSYIPRQCGIATYTKDLTTAINELNPDALAEIMAVNDLNAEYDYPWEVKFRIAQNDNQSYSDAANYINQSGAELVSIQHEFGLFGGQYGEHIVSFLEKIRRPVVTTFHTVLDKPDPQQVAVVERVARMSKAIIVMVHCAAERLNKIYGVSKRKIVTIYHGVPDIPLGPSLPHKVALNLQDYSILATINLLSSNKGVEYVIKAMPEILAKHPKVLYLVIGKTHPVVQKSEGERYRLYLEKLVKELKVEENVRFINRYLPLGELISYLRATDIYITPYLDPQQITSGALAYAIGAGKTCVSTPYVYAKEALANGRGYLVPFRDSGAVSEAVRNLLEELAVKENMERKAYGYGRHMTWSNVALKHLDLFCLVAKENGS